MTFGGVGVKVGTSGAQLQSLCPYLSVGWPISMTSHSAYSKSALQVNGAPLLQQHGSRAEITMLQNVISTNWDAKPPCNAYVGIGGRF